METQSTDDYEVNIEEGVNKKIKKLKKKSQEARKDRRESDQARESVHCILPGFQA